MAILDRYGKPFKKEMLKTDIARPSITGVRTSIHDSVTYGLTPYKLANVLTSADENDILEYLTLAEEMEEKDLHYSDVLNQRKTAVAAIEPQVIAPTDDEKDLQIADEIRAMLKKLKIENVIYNVLDGLGKGFSVSEINWDVVDSKLIPVSINWKDPRYFQFDDLTRTQIRLRDESNYTNGIELPQFKFLTYKPTIKSGIPIRGGFARLIAFSFMMKNYSLKDWMAFAEVFGMPLRVGKYSPNSAQDDINALITAVANLGTDAAAVLPDTMEIDFVSASSNGNSTVFENLASYIDKQVSKAVIGQTMTTDDGSSQSQAKVHQEVRADICSSDAKQIANRIKEDIVVPYVKLNYGENTVCPEIKMEIEEVEDLGSFTSSIKEFIDRGLKVEASQIRDKFRLQEPAKDAEILHPIKKETEKTEDEKEVEEDKENNSVSLNAKAQDDIDRIVDEYAGEWEEVTESMIQSVLNIAKDAKNFEEFEEQLLSSKKDINLDLFTTSVAMAMFKGRFNGDQE